jgi:hypothetical protein
MPVTRASRCWAAATCLSAGAAASCFIKPDPPNVSADGSPGRDAPGPPQDGHSSDGGQIGCANPSVSIHFPGMALNNCGNSWAITSGGPIGTSGGSLFIRTVNASVSSCTSLTTGAGGAISVVAVPSAPNDSVFLDALTTTGPLAHMRLVIRASARQLEISGLGGTVTRSYDPTNMKWWRLSASAPNTLVGEFSADGVTWTMLGVEPTGPQPATSVTMSFGVSSTGQGSGAFDDYVECD